MLISSVLSSFLMLTPFLAHCFSGWMSPHVLLREPRQGAEEQDESKDHPEGVADPLRAVILPPPGQ